MKTVTVIAHQSLLDIAVQEYGNAEAAFEIAVANNLDATDKLEPGMSLLIPELRMQNAELRNPEILKYYRARNLQPATGSPLLQYKDFEDEVGEPGDVWFNALPGMLPYLLS